jgi:penicillin-binding protein 1C
MKKILIFIILGGVLFSVWMTFALYNLVHGIPKFEHGSITLTGKNGTLLTEKWLAWWYSKAYRGNTHIKLIQSIIAVEDRRFYEHSGIDILWKLGSIKANILAKKIVRGGSTISEQYIKNAYFPENTRTIKEKAYEAISALIYEQYTTKEDILRKYLDNVYLWDGIYGIQAWSEIFFWKSNLENLNDDEIVEIITRIHSPNKDTNDIYRISVANKLGLKNIKKPVIQKKWYYQNLYPLLTEKIEKSLKEFCEGQKNSLIQYTENIPDTLCESNHINLTLTVDGNLMSFVQNTLETSINTLREKNIKNGAVYIYNPNSMKVLAYIWNAGSGYKWDMIIRKRSVWSVLKPFIYLLALENGATPESYILDDEKSYPTGYNEKWFVPQNYIPKSYGPIKLREALWNSLNSATVRISETIWIGKIYDFFRRIWLDMEHDAGYYGYGISIGTVELSLENVVQAYTTLTDINNPEKYMIAKILSDGRNRARTFGISSILNTSIPIPVKTGTSTDFRDNWTVSYSPDAIIGVWVGNSDNSPMIEVSGVTGAWSIWHKIAEYMIEKWMIRDFLQVPPKWIQEMSICIDRSCIQKEIQITNTTWLQKSRPKEWIYYKTDFYGEISNDEMRKWNIGE